MYLSLPTLYLLTAAISLAYVLLIAYYLYGWRHTQGIDLGVANNTGRPLISVSIIIPVRNEASTILKCLKAIASQTYPIEQFEVVVVDDHSQDETLEVIRESNFKNVRTFQLAESQYGKKAAITQGVEASIGSLMVTTDADCVMGPAWLESIVSFYNNGQSKMIVAPVLLHGETSLLQRMQVQEMTILTACAAGALYKDRPLLCSGANLAYEKKIFMDLGGYEGNGHISSGDDLFLMLKIHRNFPGRVRYLKSKEAAVYSSAESGVKSTLGQRKRWASKTFYYDSVYVTGIAILIFLTNFLILISGIMSAINLKFVLLPIICFSAKFLVDFMLLYSASHFFCRKTYPITFVLASIIYPLYVSITAMRAVFFNYSWKGRKS